MESDFNDISSLWIHSGENVTVAEAQVRVLATHSETHDISISPTNIPIVMDAIARVRAICAMGRMNQNVYAWTNQHSVIGAGIEILFDRLFCLQELGVQDPIVTELEKMRCEYLRLLDDYEATIAS